jgi:hypothetical protein
VGDVKKLGESAIHDKGFQFYIVLYIKFQMEKLLEEIHALKACINTHTEWKKESWYNSKTAVKVYQQIDGCKDHYPSFTLVECKKILGNREVQYNSLLTLCEAALKDAVKSSQNDPAAEYRMPYFKDVERNFVIVDEDS